MKTLTAVVVFILLAITAGGVTGYFLYTDLVKDEARIIVRQQSEIDTQAENIQTLQKEVIAQNKQLNKDTKTIKFAAIASPGPGPCAPRHSPGPPSPALARELFAAKGSLFNGSLHASRKASVANRRRCKTNRLPHRRFPERTAH